MTSPDIDPSDHAQLALLAAACCLAKWVHLFRREAYDLAEEDWKDLSTGTQGMYIDHAMELLRRLAPIVKSPASVPNGGNSGQPLPARVVGKITPEEPWGLCLYCAQEPATETFAPYGSKECALRAEQE